jgi:metallo-beta-lactamase class B
VANYIIDSGDGLILIDASVPHTVYLTFESIRKLGFNPKDIRLLLVSHAHYDHCGGVRPVVNRQAK